ncbi:MAG: sulfotransferase [Anaerolineales bacterium]|nr:sulfotransferase [Anaerolineales bacterium]
MRLTSHKMRQRLSDAWAVLAHGAEIARQRTAIPSITEGEIEEVKAFFPMDKFFIFGHSRSGNTLLMRLVRLHPEVHANYQGVFFSRPPGLKAFVNTPEIEEWLKRGTNRWNLGRDLSPLVMRAAGDFILERDARRNSKRIVGDKSPTTVTAGQAIREAHQIYPDAKIVYIVRDGRDVMVSDRFRNFVEEKFLRRGDEELIASFRRTPKLFTGGGHSIFTESWLRDKNQGVPSWEINLRESRLEGKRLYGDHYFEIRYEDILADPFKELTRLWLFLGVKKVPAALEKNLKEEISINPDEEWQAKRNNSLASILQKGQAGNWRTFFNERDRAIFKEIAGDLLVEWGYEQDLKW